MESTFHERMQHYLNSPKATAVQVSDGELQLTLETGAKLSLPVRMLRPLQKLTDEQIAGVRLIEGGRVLFWRDGGEGIVVEGLLEAATGLKSLHASAAKGGRAKSEAKTAAVRANGAKGGRPRKVVTAE
jgi:hypothetical protein